MNRLEDHKYENKQVFKTLIEKIKKTARNVESDIKSLGELANIIPSKLSKEDMTKLTRSVNNMSARIKMYQQKIEKFSLHLRELKSKNSKYIKAYDSMATNSIDMNAMINENAGAYVDTELHLNKLTESVNDLENLLDQFKREANIETEKTKLKTLMSEVFSEDLPNFANELKKVFPTDDYVTHKIKENVSCVDGKCTVLESEVKRIKNKSEATVDELRFKIDNLMNVIEMMSKEKYQRENELMDEITNLKLDMANLRNELLFKMKKQNNFDNIKRF